MRQAAKGVWDDSRCRETLSLGHKIVSEDRSKQQDWLWPGRFQSTAMRWIGRDGVLLGAMTRGPISGGAEMVPWDARDRMRTQAWTRSDEIWDQCSAMAFGRISMSGWGWRCVSGRGWILGLSCRQRLPFFVDTKQSIEEGACADPHWERGGLGSAPFPRGGCTTKQ